jgi:oligosaccharide repeat unit polymerase
MTANSLLGALALAMLGWVNFWFGGSVRYPPALFSFWWALLLAALWCSGDAFLPISASTVAIYMLGPCAMTAGGVIAAVWSGRESGHTFKVRKWECREGVLTTSTVLLAFAFPVFWYRIGELSAMSGVRDFWVGVRLQTMHPDRSGNTLGIFEYLIFFSTMLALAAFENSQVRNRGWLRALAAVILSLLYHLVTASRLGALMLIAGLVGIAVLHNRRIVTPLLIGAVAVIPVFVSVAVALNKGTERGGDIQSNTVSLARSFQLYALGGLVAFDAAADGRIAQENRGRTYRSLYTVVRAAGYDIDVPALPSEYTYTPTPTNVYTLYYPYLLDFGRMGVVILLCGFGALFSHVYFSARSAAGPFTVAYALMFAYVLLSSADEYLFSLASMNCQAALYLLLLYRRSNMGMENANFA